MRCGHPSHGMSRARCADRKICRPCFGPETRPRAARSAVTLLEVVRDGVKYAIGGLSDRARNLCAQGLSAAKRYTTARANDRSARPGKLPSLASGCFLTLRAVARAVLVKDLPRSVLTNPLASHVATDAAHRGAIRADPAEGPVARTLMRQGRRRPIGVPPFGNSAPYSLGTGARPCIGSELEAVGCGDGRSLPIQIQRANGHGRGA